MINHINRIGEVFQCQYKILNNIIKMKIYIWYTSAKDIFILFIIWPIMAYLNYPDEQEAILQYEVKKT
jgi:hypothetical protein